MVIPNRDGAHWLEGCLGTLTSAAPAPAEIIVSDDGSSDASAEVARRHGARFLESGRPAGSGFAATANRGLRSASGDWVLLLNNDTEVLPDTFAQLAEVAAARPDAGVLAPLVLSLRDRVSIDSAGLLLYPDGTARPRWHGRRADAVRVSARDVLLPSGAAMAVRADVLARVGLLDERLGSYLEDVDWSLRAQRLGVRMALAPGAVVYHHFSGTAGAFSATKARLVERNRVIVAVRHLPLGTLLASPLWTLARWGALARASRRAGAGSGGQGASGAALRGAAAGLAAVPSAVRERRALAREAPVAAREWRRRLARDRARPRDFLTFGAG